MCHTLPVITVNSTRNPLESKTGPRAIPDWKHTWWRHQMETFSALLNIYLIDSLRQCICFQMRQTQFCASLLIWLFGHKSLLSSWVEPTWKYYGGPEGTSLHKFFIALHIFWLVWKNIMWLCIHNYLACIHKYLACIHKYLACIHNYLACIHNYLACIHNYLYMYA